MKSRLTILLLSLALPAAESMAAESGTYIEQNLVREAVAGQPAIQGVQKIWFTQKHIRNETVFGQTTNIALIDLEADKIILMPSDEKQYVEMKLADYMRIVRMRLSSSKLNDASDTPELQKTDETKQIGDWNCTKYVYQQNGTVKVKSVLWVSKQMELDFASYVALMKKLGMEKALGRLADFVERIDGYPVEVRTEQTMDKQTLISTTRLVKTAKGPVDPLLFEIPQGYKRLGGKEVVPGGNAE